VIGDEVLMMGVVNHPSLQQDKRCPVCFFGIDIGEARIPGC
jgi:hypothetical protein